jgi:proteasome lid subunit RPN8/RPN11
VRGIAETVLLLSRRDFNVIVRHSEETYPVEACGILIGKASGSKKTVKRARRTRNILNSESRYQVDPAEQLKAFEESEKRDQQVLGFYHSHPDSPAFFSEIDRAQAYYPRYSYLVYSVKGRDLRSYVPKKDGIREEKVRITPSLQ